MRVVAVAGVIERRPAADAVDRHRTRDLHFLARRGAGKAADVDHLARGIEQALFFQPDHVRQRLDLVEHGQLLEEGLDVRQRDRIDRIARARLRVTGDLGAAVDVGQAEHVTRVDQVRVLDLRVGLPDFRPQPRLLEEAGRDVPQGVALADRVGRRMIPAHFRREGETGEREQHGSENCRKAFKHGCYPPDSPRQAS